MFKKRSLHNRWLNSQGQDCLKQLLPALQEHRNTEEIKPIVFELAYAQEVLPRLDLRAIPMEGLPPLFRMDLSYTDFSHVKLETDVLECRMAGSIFDSVEANTRTFSGDFFQTSFVNAELVKSRFQTIRLTEADFSNAKLVNAQLKQQNLRSALFVGADMRQAEFTGSDIRGADLSGSNCIGAAFGEVLFDNNTRFHKCRLSSGFVSADLEAFAVRHGAIIEKRSDQNGQPQISALIDLLDSRNIDDNHTSLLRKLKTIRDRAGEDIHWDWLDYISQRIPEDQVRVLKEAYEGVTE